MLKNEILIDYIDVKQATIQAIRDFADMIWKVEHSKEKIAEIDARLQSPKGASTGERVKGGASAEDSLCAAIDKKDLLMYGEEQATRFVEWFLPAWNRLTEEAKVLLQCRYGRKGKNLLPWYDAVKEYGVQYEKSMVYYKCDDALEWFTTLLYWKP